MNYDERRALSALRLEYSPTPEDVWAPLEFHVSGLNSHAEQTLMNAVFEAKQSKGPSPLGVVLIGEKGAGKTHTLGWLRERVQGDGGYFFLLGLFQGKTFWQSVAHAFLLGLRRGQPGQSQLATFLQRTSALVGIEPEVADAVTGNKPLQPSDVAAFVTALRTHNGPLGQECQHTARALILLGSGSFAAQDVGEAYLASNDEAAPGERGHWGIHSETKPPQQIIGEVSQLLALTGPSVVALDQIDIIIAQSTKSADPSGPEQLALPEDVLVEQMAVGLMNLRELTRRTVAVAACQPGAWGAIKNRALNSVSDRFREATRLSRIPTPELGQAIVAARFTPRFQDVGFVPEYPTWPIKASAFKDAQRFTPRLLLKQIDAHIQACLQTEQLTELQTLDPQPVEAPIAAAPPSVVDTEELDRLDKRFGELKRAANISAAINPETEDIEMPVLLAAGLRAWIRERDAHDEQYSIDPPQGGSPALHARLRLILDESIEDEVHWAFRSIMGTHHATVRNRIDRASVVAALDPNVPKRKLFILRRLKWQEGKVTHQRIAEYLQAGGIIHDIADDDLRAFKALQKMLAESDKELAAWLAARKPAGSTGLMREAFGEITSDAASVETDVVDEGVGPVITVGTRAGVRVPVQLDLELLRKHIAVFAGSGSGKTVLIRRIVEECALQGVSAIVLDPNNDLARLGDKWPDQPGVWSSEDARKATDYIANTDVVVWTPRREAGRPLSFQPLPDFGAVMGDKDEFDAAIDAAVAALAPRAMVAGGTAKALQGRAVLTETLTYFAKHKGTALDPFIKTLANLPSGVSTIGNASKLAADMADNLAAAKVTDPLFGGSGDTVDPGVLLTPEGGKRSRISVVSFVGLPSDAQRQSFVNQLQMALFAWIKKHPAGNRPLGGLLIMDEAQTLAPSVGKTVCTQSTIALASQARKYGLGLVFATQAPKGIHNQIPGNAATQFFGYLNSTTQINAAKELAAAKDSSVPDISQLTTGQFYLASEGTSFEKILTSLCLSYHPTSPLTTEEVIKRAKHGFGLDT